MFFKKKQKNNFKTYKDYKLNKTIFRLCILAIFIYFALIVFVNGFEPVYYYNCSAPNGCELEPFDELCHEPSSLENLQYPNRLDWMLDCGLCRGGHVEQGFSCGSPVGWGQGSEIFVSIIIILSAFIINHFLYNRQYEWEDKEK